MGYVPLSCRRLLSPVRNHKNEHGVGFSDFTAECNRDFPLGYPAPPVSFDVVRILPPTSLWVNEIGLRKGPTEPAGLHFCSHPSDSFVSAAGISTSAFICGPFRKTVSHTHVSDLGNYGLYSILRDRGNLLAIPVRPEESGIVRPTESGVTNGRRGPLRRPPVG